MLLERPGELVTREELQQVLWPSDTHVDFERGVNARRAEEDPDERHEVKRNETSHEAGNTTR